MTTSKHDLVSAALAYAERGITVFPVHIHPDSERPGKVNKKPLVDWGREATTTFSAIESWVTLNYFNGLGMPTGHTNGIFALDIDIATGGDLSLAALERTHDDLPDTRVVITGSGGRHYWFVMPPTIDLRNTAGQLGSGIDTRANGGYVVVPPSNYPGGRTYKFEIDWTHGEETPLADLPAWLLDLALVKARGPAPPIPDIIPEGEREATLVSMAGTMRKRGWTAREMLALLEVANEDRCRPPLEQRDLERIAGSVARYEPETPVAPDVSVTATNNGTEPAPTRDSKAEVDQIISEETGKGGSELEIAWRAVERAAKRKDWAETAKDDGLMPYLGSLLAERVYESPVHNLVRKAALFGGTQAFLRDIEDHYPSGYTKPTPVKRPITTDKTAQFPQLAGWPLQVNRYGDPLENEANYISIFDHHPHFQEHLKFDAFFHAPIYQGDVFSEDLVTNLTPWFAREPWYFGGNARVPKEKALIAVSQTRPIDTLQSFIKSVPAWDGVKRLDTWLNVYTGAIVGREGEDEKLSKDADAFVGRLLILQMLSRALNPGCVARVVVVFEGPENTGKSQAIRILGHPWSGTFDKAMDSREASMSMPGKWVLEFPELASFRKTGDESLKAFLTLQVDTFFYKHSNKPQHPERRTIFIGSTNDSQYLAGETGNTRFNPIKTGEFDLEGLAAVRDQLFAEGLVILEKAPKYWEEPGDIRALLALRRKERQHVSTHVDPLNLFLQNPRVVWKDRLPCCNWVSHETVLKGYLGLDAKDWERHKFEAFRALRQAGWENKKLYGVRLWHRVEPIPCGPNRDKNPVACCEHCQA
ncbi:MAG: VapE domain-containing protein [Gammaproteobacteria bacterium]